MYDHQRDLAMIRLLLVMTLSLIAANCGQKGPLEPPTANGADASQAASAVRPQQHHPHSN